MKWIAWSFVCRCVFAFVWMRAHRMLFVCSSSSSSLFGISRSFLLCGIVFTFAPLHRLGYISSYLQMIHFGFNMLHFNTPVFGPTTPRYPTTTMTMTKTTTKNFLIFDAFFPVWRHFSAAPSTMDWNFKLDAKKVFDNFSRRFHSIRWISHWHMPMYPSSNVSIDRWMSDSLLPLQQKKSPRPVATTSSITVNDRFDSSIGQSLTTLTNQIADGKQRWLVQPNFNRNAAMPFDLLILDYISAAPRYSAGHSVNWTAEPGIY